MNALIWLVRTAACCLVLSNTLSSVAAVQGNMPPAAPVITEPAIDGQEASYGDVHMETAPFADPNPGDTHACTDWEIWRVNPPELAWRAWCIGGPERVHAHLRDGIFVNSHLGRRSLVSDADYLLRVRHKDSSADPSTQWSAWSERLFRTSPASAVPALEMDDIADDVIPIWIDSSGQAVVLPAPVQPGAWATLQIESMTGEPLLGLRASTGLANQVINAPALDEHAAVRVRISANLMPVGSVLTLAPSTLTVADHEGHAHTIYMPAISIDGGGAGSDVLLWVSSGGATYFGSEGQSEPDFTTIARSQALPWALRKPGYRLDVVATGFQLPVNIAFIPNPAPGPDAPLYYVNELFGTVKVVTRSGAVSDYATNLLNYTAYSAFGLTGIVVEPVTGDVFVSMVWDSLDPPGLYVPRIVRLHSTDGGRTASSQSLIFYAPGENQGSSHQISTLAIVDGKLMVNSADGFFTELAQNLDYYRGKILRMNLDGSAPPDNPFYNAADGISARDYIFASGFRNPFGGAWRASDNAYYEVENGPATDRFARVDAGRNYMWDGTDASMHEGAIYTWFHAHAPTNIAFIQPQTFGGSLFPPDTMDRAYVAESGPTGLAGPQFLGKRVSEFVLGPNAELISGPTTLVEYDGSGVATVVALAAGPDGLYFSDFFKDDAVSDPFPVERGSNILRIRYVGEAEFTSDTTSGNLPLTVQFTDVSTVVNPTAWEWSFGDGTTSTLQNPVHTYTQPGVYDVRLAITGAGGLLVEHKSCFVRAGAVTRIAMVGAAPLAAGDQQMLAHLVSRGHDVQVFDAAGVSRPSADQLASMFDVIMLAPSSVGPAIGQEFRSAAAPIITWDPATIGVDRIPLSDAVTTLAGQSSINLRDNRHPITLGRPIGITSIYSPAATMSFINGNLPSGASYLATRVGATGDQALVAADGGAELLGGHRPPARRVFLGLRSGLTGATATAIEMVDHAVDWAARYVQPTIQSHPGDITLPAGSTLMYSVEARGSGLAYRWYRDDQPMTDGGRVSGTMTSLLRIADLGVADAGNYRVEVTNACSMAVSNTAVLTIGCQCDWNASGALNSQDYFDFLAALFLDNADYNNDGQTNSQDFFDFISCFFAGC